jgi:predicted N-acetyltransferase YhbS
LNNQVTIFQDFGCHDAAVNALYQRAFGPGRFAKAASRLRENNKYCQDFSFLARLEDHIVGACRIWPVTGANGVDALFLGPIAVDASMRSLGLGQQLVEACLKQIDTSVQRQNRHQVIILVGDHAYFGRQGFEVVPNAQIAMPGPVDPARLLWRIGKAEQDDWPLGLLSVRR